MSILKKAKTYMKFVQEILKQKYDGKFKSPLQLKGDERKQFFSQVKSEWNIYKKSEKNKKKSSLIGDLFKTKEELQTDLNNLQTKVNVFKKMEDAGALTKSEQEYLSDIKLELIEQHNRWLKLLSKRKH